MTINTTVEELLDIEDALVSEENPARDDGILTMSAAHDYTITSLRMGGWPATEETHLISMRSLKVSDTLPNHKNPEMPDASHYYHR
jgi:hypothetical protein